LHPIPELASLSHHLTGDIANDVGSLLRGRLSGFRAGEEQARTDHQDRHWYCPRQPEQRIRHARSDGHGLHRVSPGRGGDIIEKLFAPAFDIAGDLGLDSLGAYPLANVAGSLCHAGFQLLDGIAQASPRLFGIAFDLLQRTGISGGHGSFLRTTIYLKFEPLDLPLVPNDVSLRHLGPLNAAIVAFNERGWSP
jgi:hypothetical protein